MLGIDLRAARAAWSVFLVALLVATAYTVRITLAVFMIALLFAYLLMPLVSLVERLTPRLMPATLALAIVYLIMTGVIVALAITVGSSIVDQASSLAARLPELLKNRAWIEQIPLPHWLDPVRARLTDMLQTELNSGGKDILPYIGSFGGQLVSGARYILYVVLVPILAFFFLKDGPAMKEGLLATLAPGARRGMLEDILNDINHLLGQYIRAMVLLALTSFVGNAMFLAITGAPYALLLALVCGVAEFVPVVGPASAAAIVMIVAGLSGYDHLVWFLLFFVLFRMFQDYVVSPYVMGSGVELNPMLVLFGVLAGEQIAGVTGMVFSVPIIATLRVIFVRLRRRSRVALLETPT